MTVAQYRACVTAGGCSDEGIASAFWSGAEQPSWSRYCNWPKPERGNHPINCVDWKQAVAFCRWAGKRLPTEMEWEKAARGTDGRKYPWGNVEYEAAGRVANIADVQSRVLHPEWNMPLGYDDGYLDTAPVGSFPAGKTVYGGFDMMGNVWEFAADEYWPGSLGSRRIVEQRRARRASLGSPPGGVRLPQSVDRIPLPPLGPFFADRESLRAGDV